MGGRGASSGADFRQLTLDRVLLINELTEIRTTADKIRATMEGVGSSSGGKSTLRKKQCFCCEEFSLPMLSEYEECEVCGWIDDPYQNKYPDSLIGRNLVCLNDAREAYRKRSEFDN